MKFKLLSFLSTVLVVCVALPFAGIKANAISVGEKYYIKNWSGNAVTISSYENGANVTMESFTGEDNQIFVLEVDSKSKCCLIKNPASDKYLEVRNSGMSDDDVVGLWQDNGQLCARWQIYENKNYTSPYMFKNANSGLYMNVQGDSEYPGTQLIQYHYDGTSAMRFYFEKVPENKKNLKSNYGYSTGYYTVSDYDGVRVRINTTGNSIRGAASKGTRFYVSKVEGEFGYTDSIQTTNYGVKYGWIYLPACTYDGSGNNNNNNNNYNNNNNNSVNTSDSFDLTKAKQFWIDHAYNHYTDKYYSFSSDCCNGFAQSLIEGGLPENRYFHASRDWGYPTCTVTNVPSLIQYFRVIYGVKYYNNTGVLGVGTVSKEEFLRNTNYDGVTENTCDGTSFSINDIQEGDAVTINGDKGRNHIVYVLYVDYNNQKIHIAGHTTNVYDDTYDFYMIKGVLKTSALARNNNSNNNGQNNGTGKLRGDINGDGKISNTDVIRLNIYLSDPTGNIDVNVYDVTEDGFVDYADLEAMNLYSVGLLNSMTEYKPQKIMIYSTIKKNRVDQVFDVYYGKYDSETPITLAGYHGGYNQVFELIPYDKNKKYYFIRCSYTNKYWNINRGSDKNMYGKLQIYDFYGGGSNANNMIFKFEKDNKTGYTYIRAKDGSYINIDRNGNIYATSSKSAYTMYQTYTIKYL